MSYYPVAINLAGRRCLVIGGGEVALRKVRGLLDAGAVVRVIAPEVDPRMLSYEIEITRRRYHPGDVAGFALVYCAVDDPSVARQASLDAEAHGVLFNAADQPELCSFIVPSLVRRGDLLIAVTTSGKSPALSKKIRQQLEEIYGPEYGMLVELMGELRDRVKSQFATQQDREVVFNRVLDSPVINLLKEGRLEEARQMAISLIF